jgi:hypothetical protein
MPYFQVPANQITYKYTSGNEYMFVSTQRNYQGHYYEFNDKVYAGKEFNINAPELIRITSKNLNPFLSQVASIVYGKLTKVKINNISPQSYIFNPDKVNTNDVIRYFIANIKNNPLIIKEVNEKVFGEFQNNPIYISVALPYQNSFKESDLKEAEKKMPGITIFVNSTYSPGVTD